MPQKTRRRTYKGGFTQYLNQLKGLTGKLGGLKGLTGKLGGLKGLTGKFGNLKGKFGGITSKLKGIPGLNQFSGANSANQVQEWGQPSAPPMNMPPQQAQYAIPSAPPMAQIVPPPSQNVIATLKQKYPNLKPYVLASNGQYYPAENYAKYGAKGGKKTRRRRRRN